MYTNDDASASAQLKQSQKSVFRIKQIQEQQQPQGTSQRNSMTELNKQIEKQVIDLRRTHTAMVKRPITGNHLTQHSTFILPAKNLDLLNSMTNRNAGSESRYKTAKHTRATTALAQPRQSVVH